MPVKPTLLKEIRRTAVQAHKENTGYGSYNRFELLSPRGRTFSAGKRQLDPNEPEVSAPKTPRLDSNAVFSQLTQNDKVIDEVDTVLASIESEGTNLPADPRIDKLCKVMKLLAQSNRNLTSALVDANKVNNQPKLAPPRAVITARRPSVTAARPTPPPPTAEESLTKKVKQALHDAEKKTVIFNVDMGTCPVMNKATLSRKLTESLATAVKSGKHDYHIGDAEEVLDDILSCSKLEFLGSGSKLFFNSKNENDPRNNKMHTIPVRMDFEDRETRFEAEVMLRKLCKVNCSVPYPKRMRTILLELVNKGKAYYPNSFIRTKVNVDKLTVEAHAKTANGWVDLGLKQKIPLDILGGAVDPVLAAAVVQVSQPSQPSQASQVEEMSIESSSQPQIS
jgi:hypothetical protein